MTHTPGPWRIEKSPHSNVVSDIIGATDWCVAEEIENLDDARLIAAAPDLLAALRAVVRICDRKTDEFDAARAAIAKATGA